MSGPGTRVAEFKNGRLKTAVFRRVTDLEQQHWNDEEVRIPDILGTEGMVAVGGGGIGAEVPQGALLTASRPNGDLSGWLVSSKDHLVPNPHRLTTFVIGLSVDGVSRQDLKAAITVTRASSPVQAHPEVTVGLPARQVLLGGGFRANFGAGAGSLATASFPRGGGWVARSKDHKVSDPVVLDGFLLSLPSDFAGLQLRSIAIPGETGGAQHPAVTTPPLPPGFVPTGGGGEVHLQEPGCLLWKLQPPISAAPTFTAAAKDHVLAVQNSLTAWIVGITG
jgi:hypothetical protein